MPPWTNFVAIAAPANGTNSHTVSPSSGNVVAGALFTPKPGRLLVVIAYGSVTSSTPSGWQLRDSEVNFGGLYVWTKTADGGSADDFTTTHNGSNYPAIFAIFEFAEGSSWVASNGTVNLAGNAANPALTGLSGSPLVIAVKAGADSTAGSTATGTWSGETEELIDHNVDLSGSIDGYWFHLGYAANYESSTYQPTSTRTGMTGNCEAITLAIDAVPLFTPVIAVRTDYDPAAGSTKSGIAHQFQRGTFTAAGRDWLFFCTGASTLTHGVYYVTSSDGGETWDEEPTLVRLFDEWDPIYDPSMVAVDIEFDGVYLHYALSGPSVDADNPLYYRRGRPLSDGTIQWSAPEQLVVTHDSSILEVGIAVDSNRVPWITYERFNFNLPTPYVVKATSADGTWTMASGFPHQLSDVVAHWWTGIVRMGNQGQMAAIYWHDDHEDGSEDEHTTWAKFWDGSQWSNPVPIDTPRRLDLADFGICTTAAYVSDPENGVLHFVWRDRDLSTTVNVWSGDASGGTVDDTLEALADSIAVGLDTATGDLVIAYLENARLLLARRSAAGVWETPDLVDDQDGLVHHSALQISERGSRLLLAYQVQDESNFDPIYVLALGALVAEEPPVNIEPPVVTGDAVVGGTLVVDPGEWEGADTFSFQWQRRRVSA